MSWKLTTLGLDSFCIFYHNFYFFSFNPVLLSKCFLSFNFFYIIISFCLLSFFIYFFSSFFLLSFIITFLFTFFLLCFSFHHFLLLFCIFYSFFTLKICHTILKKNGQQSILKNILVDIAIIHNDNKCHPVQYQYYPYFIDIDSNLKIICIVVLYDSITEYSPTINVP